MERKIGEIFKRNGEWYQCIKSNDTCAGCAGKSQSYSFCKGFGRCTDKIFKKLEKVGEPYEYFMQGTGIILVQEYILASQSYISGDGVIDCKKDGRVAIEIKQNKEDMEEKKPTYDELLHYYNSTVGLWAIDRSPQEVSLNWICDNAFQLGIDEKDSNSEKVGKNLRPFDLQKAREGKPVYTRDGRKARIICFDYKGDSNAYPILALILTSNLSGVPSEIIAKYTEDGRYAKYNNVENNEDLMMLPEKKEGWVNVYKGIDGVTFSTHPYTSKDEAIKKSGILSSRIDTIKVSWEE